MIVGDYIINLYNFFFVKMEIKESANQSAVLLGDRQPFFLSSKVSSRSEREREREGAGRKKKKEKKEKRKKIIEYNLNSTRSKYITRYCFSFLMWLDIS